MSIWNSREECLDLEERAQQQLERLQSTLNRAFKNVPFYRNQLESNRVDPSQIEALSDLGRIPFTEREFLSVNYPYGLFAVPLRDVVRIHTAPGTTLKPMVSGYTRQDLQVWREMVARAFTSAGVSSSDILQIVLDPGLANWGRDYKDGAEAIEASVIPLTVLPSEKNLMVMHDYKTSVLIASSSAASHLMNLLFHLNLNPNALALRTLILVGGAPDPHVRNQLEEQLHVETWVHYGLSEIPGPAIGFECEHRRGLHINEDHFFPEVVDSASGDIVAEGEEGELVLTTLTTRAFPLIRFRTGDRVRFIADPCSCGRTLKKIEWIPGRTDKLMVVRGVKVHHQQILLLLERALGYIPKSFRILIKRQEYRDFIEVWLGLEDRLFSDEIKEMEKIIQNLNTELTQELGIPVIIRLKEKRSLETYAESSMEDLR
ncbi:MAG: phenylacetate--CoA ligase family protein [Desulfoferrobacter sp.]